jgi:general secretion pathway protein H
LTGRRHTQGFTLIELLVVLVIIAILTGVAVISLGALGRDPPAKQAADQLAELMDMVSQEAIMRGQEYGLRVEPHAYQFLLYDGHTWGTPADDSLFAKHDLGDDVSFSLQLEGTPVTLAPAAVTDATVAASTSSAPAGADTVTPTPQVMLLSSGELTPFEITVTGADKNAPYTIKGTLVDGIQLLAPDDPRKP